MCWGLTGGCVPSGLAVDYHNERLYWADAKLSVIGSIRLNGTDPVVAIDNKKGKGCPVGVPGLGPTPNPCLHMSPPGFPRAEPPVQHRHLRGLHLRRHLHQQPHLQDSQVRPQGCHQPDVRPQPRHRRRALPPVQAARGCVWAQDPHPAPPGVGGRCRGLVSDVRCQRVRGALAELGKRGRRAPARCPKWGCVSGQSRGSVGWVGGVQLQW